MKVLFRLYDGTSVTGEGPTWRDALLNAGLKESDRSKIISSQEENLTPVASVMERNEDHPLYGLSFDPGTLRPTLRKIVYFAEHQSMLVRAIPKKDKWLHHFNLPSHILLSFLGYFEHHLTQVVQPNHEQLLQSFKARYTTKKTAVNLQLDVVISELEELMEFNESITDAIADMQVDIGQLTEMTMGGLLTQKVDVMAPYVGMRKIPEEELLFHFFKSNWLSRQVSMYRHELDLVRKEYPLWETIFSLLYEWVAYCRAYDYNRISEASAHMKNLFASEVKIPITMVLSADSYQYILSPKGYVEDRLEKQFDTYGATIPRAINLRAACYKWLRQCVLRHTNIVYLPNGQIALGKGNLKRTSLLNPVTNATFSEVKTAPVSTDEPGQFAAMSDSVSEKENTELVVSPDTVVEEETPVTVHTIQFLDSVDSLKLQNTEYVICGSAAAVLYGSKSTNTDVDVCIPQDIIDRLLQEGLIKEGEKDGIHDANYQSLDGHVDIASTEQSIIASTWGWSDWLNNSVVTMGYTFLTKEALTTFYEKLADHTKADKHRDVWNNLKNEISHGSNSDTL